MRESSRIQSTLTYFSQQIGAEHLAAIGEIDRRGDMAGVAVLGLDGGELRGEFGTENEREAFGGVVGHGLGDEVGEGHGMAAERAVIRVDTRVSRRARLRDSPIE